MTGSFAIVIRGGLILALSFLGVAAHAVQPNALTVPWVATNPLIPHDAFSGVPTTLKGTADVQGANFQYTWDFGDGTPVATGVVTNRYVIQAAHTYTGPVGSIFVATLTIRDNNTGESDSANYLVALRDMTLETEVNVAIDDGLWYLHSTMTRAAESGVDYGVWTSGFAGSGTISNWASNVQAFEVNGHLEIGSATNPYTETVRRGLAGVLRSLIAVAIPTSQTNPLGTFNPDANGNGHGVRVNQANEFYEGGMVMDAFVASGTPNAIAQLGPLPAGANPGIRGRTYQSIVQDYADYYAYCQYDFGTIASGGGGWRYSCNSFPDGSANQWAAIGIIGSVRSFGGVVHQLVYDFNKVWIDYAHDAATGISGYTSSGAIWGPYATTPSGTVQMAMTGIGRGNSLWDTSETFLRNTFCNNTNNAGSAIRDYYYGWFSFTKSMLLHDSNGDKVAEPITLLAQQPSGASPIDWYAAEASKGAPCDGVARQLVNDQNPAGYWYAHNFTGEQYTFETGWAIIMLNRTVFASGVPVAVATANPNPAVGGQNITLDGSASFHQDAAKTITSWRWDFNNDGTFDATGVTAVTSFPVIGDYPVKLEVCDDGTPQECDDTTIIVRINLPPLAPTADAGGPYSFCPAQQWFLDGSSSTNPDDGLSEPGQPGDFIKAFAWDLDNDGAFDDAAGAQPNVTAFYTPGGAGSFLARLRVTDNTATSFPSSGMGDLSGVDAAEVTVRSATDPVCACIADLTARPKSGKVQLVWGNTSPAGGYNVYRSTVSGGPYQLVANTTSAYSTYLDEGLVNGTTYYYVVRPAALNGAELCQSNQAQATPSARAR